MAIPSYVTFDGSPAPDTESKPPWRPWTRKPGLPLHPYLLTLPWWSPSQPRRLPGSSLAIPGSFPTQALHVFSPVRNVLPLTLPRPVHSEFLSLFKCSLLKEAVSVLPQCHGAPTPHGPSLASSVSLHPVNFLRITAKFPMIRWHCTIIFKSQFKITGIFSFPKRAQTPQKQR